eukprot:TRINITY_DN18165_c0_g2_i1.p1 TRINITY_DN18165_c0_g2~~TRINITY_DN18165_c0_g2_i1.p1  ORF type:complete len:257 (+),score=28.29 TRINITY_DN18165_c0_g2_i1:25-771(+)
MQPRRGHPCTHFKRNPFIGVLLPIPERRLRVRFALRYVEEFKFIVDDLGARKVVASRTQDCHVHSDEQLLYQSALTARRRTARDQLDTVNVAHARTRAEVLRTSLDMLDETHLGFDGLSGLERVEPLQQEYEAFCGTEGNVDLSDADVFSASDRNDPTLKLWSSCSFSDSDHEGAAPKFSSSSSRNSGTVMMDKLRSLRSAFSKVYSCSSSFCATTTVPRRHLLSWTTRVDNRVTPVFDDIANLGRAT